MGDYHDLYVQTDTLLLADVFEKFREKCIEIYGLDPSYFYSAPGLAWQACLKKTELKLELLTDIDLEVDIEYPKTLLGSHKDLPFLPDRKKLEKVEKLVCSLEDKEKYVIHIRALKQALNNGLKFNKCS